jgi:hypothetical protein
MEKPSKRGKIPQSDWPLIMARYDAGETLASIARTYGCSPPAISYVVSRSRAREPAAAPPPPANEPQLIKAANGDAANPANAGNSKPEPMPPAPTIPRAASDERTPAPPVRQPMPTAATPAAERRIDNRPRDVNGFGRPGNGERDSAGQAITMRPAPPAAPRPVTLHPQVAQANGDHRRTLHLSLGGGPPGNGGSHPAEPQGSDRHPAPNQTHPASQQGGGERPGPWSSPSSQRYSGPVEPPPRQTAPNRLPEAAQTAPQAPRERSNGEPPPRREGTGSFIDKELRARVDGDIAAFLAAFDAALLQDTQESRSALREATDRLLRVGARTRIELERLEARMPLPPRDAARTEPAWRHR